MKRNSKHGFSLVEISIVLVVISILALLFLFANAQAAKITQEEETKILAEAQLVEGKITNLGRISPTRLTIEIEGQKPIYFANPSKVPKLSFLKEGMNYRFKVHQNTNNEMIILEAEKTPANEHL